MARVRIPTPPPSPAAALDAALACLLPMQNLHLSRCERPNLSTRLLLNSDHPPDRSLAKLPSTVPPSEASSTSWKSSSPRAPTSMPKTR
jgi:hypothetical protein